MDFLDVTKLALNELLKATKAYPPFRSPHEGYAIILEELDELKAEVFKKPADANKAAMVKEAIQVAAMAMRFVYDLTDEPGAST